MKQIIKFSFFLATFSLFFSSLVVQAQQGGSETTTVDWVVSKTKPTTEISLGKPPGKKDIKVSNDGPNDILLAKLNPDGTLGPITRIKAGDSLSFTVDTKDYPKIALAMAGRAQPVATGTCEITHVVP